MTNIVELDSESMRPIEWHQRMQMTSQWLWDMRKAGNLPPEIAEARDVGKWGGPERSGEYPDHREFTY